MSLTVIAITGILVGFLCLVVGFLMEDSKDAHVIDLKEKRGKSMKKKIMAPKKKAA